MSRLRISAISYLNTAPLMWDFEHGEPEVRERLSREFEASYTIPARCAEALRDGQADLGIIPAVSYHDIPALRIVPGVAIASRGPVGSILLVSKPPIEEIRTVAADSASRSSVALLRVLFRKWLGGPRDFLSCPPDLAVMLGQADAALLIGDRALTVAREGYHVYDLGEEWTRRTGRPFVYAFWAVREEAVRPGLTQVLQRSRDRGLERHNVAAIAQKWAPRVGLSAADAAAYLTENIHYSLDADCLAGMEMFLDYAGECNVLTKRRELKFL